MSRGELEKRRDQLEKRLHGGSIAVLTNAEMVMIRVLKLLVSRVRIRSKWNGKLSSSKKRE